MLLNLTPHKIVVRMDDRDLEIPPSGQVARVSTNVEKLSPIHGIAVSRTVFGEVEGLPSPQEGVFLVVSTLVAQRAQRADVISPDTGPSAIRENGQVVAVRGFQAF